MDRLLELRDQHGHPKITLSFVVYKHNYRELSGFLDMARQRKVDRVIVRFFEATQEMRELVFSKEELAFLRRSVKTALQVPFEFKHNLNKIDDLMRQGSMLANVVAMPKGALRNDRLLFYDATGGRIKCHEGWFCSHIDEQGRVIAPCDNVSVCVAGNVNDRRYKDIWFDNEDLHDTLREASRGIRTRSPKWQECRYCGYVTVNSMLEEKVRRLVSPSLRSD